MKREEIVSALRCCVSIPPDCCKTCPAAPENGCEDAIKVYAADLIEKLAADRKALINELCQYCGKYKCAHEGACNGCKWKQ